MPIFSTVAELAAQVGREVAVSEWTAISQEQINLFAQATGDFQWIHVDVERAKAGPFGAPIAHGFLTLSLVPKFFTECLQVQEKVMGVNYGLNKVRFMAPVHAGSRVRARLKLLSTEPVSGPGGIAGTQFTWQAKIEREGQDKPVCMAEMLARQYPQPG
jgi:acyl dehydratase